VKPNKQQDIVHPELTQKITMPTSSSVDKTLKISWKIIGSLVGIIVVVISVNQVIDQDKPQRLVKLELQIETKKLAQHKKHDTAVKANYVIQGDGTVIDKDTGLHWMQCTLGQTWHGGTCEGETEEYKWYQALDVGNSYTYAGYSDWRVPTIYELNTLVYCSNGKSILYEEGGSSSKNIGGWGCKSNSYGKYKSPTISQSIFPNTPVSAVWSSSPIENYSDYAWYVGFDDGYTYNNIRTNSSHVRLVRSEQ